LEIEKLNLTEEWICCVVIYLGEIGDKLVES